MRRILLMLALAAAALTGAAAPAAADVEPAVPLDSQSAALADVDEGIGGAEERAAGPEPADGGNEGPDDDGGDSTPVPVNGGNGSTEDGGDSTPESVNGSTGGAAGEDGERAADPYWDWSLH